MLIDYNKEYEKGEFFTLKKEPNKNKEKILARINRESGKMINDIAKEIGIPTDICFAIIALESGGRTMNLSGKIVIRFENHVFFRQYVSSVKDLKVKEERRTRFYSLFTFSNERLWEGHKIFVNEQWVPIHTGNNDLEWDALKLAMTLDPIAAAKSASYGVGQIMGFNHLIIGLQNPVDMITLFETKPSSQFTAFFNFILNTNCYEHLKTNNLRGFVKEYNGAGQVELYMSILEEYLIAFKSVFNQGEQ